MLDLRYMSDIKTKEQYLVTSMTGKSLLTIPQLNKGTAFSHEERLSLGLIGKLPNAIETLDQQVTRAYQQFLSYESNLKRNIFLNGLLEKNQTLFYKLVSTHIEEMMPMIYTPIVGHAVKSYSLEFRQPRGLYISYPDIDHIDAILENRSHPEIDLIVVTDGEGVLGIGDQGVGGMDIPIAKLMVYTLCAGINPVRTLPILLDVGTNNKALLADPMYLGWHHPRLTGAEYDAFVDQVINAIKRKFPQVFLHWEDFGRANASRLLKRYEGEVCTFNDDIQGTGAVALAAIIAALAVSKQNLAEQRIVIHGAGTAGCGIANQIFEAMVKYHNMPAETAKQCFYLIDRQGLLHNGMSDLTSCQAFYARDENEFNLATQAMTLTEVVASVQPTILIGCSAQSGAFTESIVRMMAEYNERPIIFPLSNPNEVAEATPEDLFTWTDGKALVATGSPFADVDFQGQSKRIAQCNNALVFPGIGLGVIAVKAAKLTDNMIWAATETLAQASPLHQDAQAPLLPSLADAKSIARDIAVAVAKQALADDVARVPCSDVRKCVDAITWEPEYIPYRYGELR